MFLVISSFSLKLLFSYAEAFSQSNKVAKVRSISLSYYDSSNRKYENKNKNKIWRKNRHMYISVKQFCNDWIIIKHNLHTYSVIIIN